MYFEKCKERIKKSKDIKKFSKTGYFSESDELILVKKKQPLTEVYKRQAQFKGAKIPLEDKEFDELYQLMELAQRKCDLVVLGEL